MLSLPRFVALVLLLLRNGASLLHARVAPYNRVTLLRAVSNSAKDVYADYWREWLEAEQQEAVAELKARRASWSRKRLEESGLSVFDASAEPDSDLFGEKIVRVYKEGETRFRDRFARGDVLVMTSISRAMSKHQAIPKECCIVDVGNDWMTLAVGPAWPPGLWESRRLPRSYQVRLDRTAPRAPLKAQKIALEQARKGEAGEVASLLVDTFVDGQSDAINATSNPPSRFKDYSPVELETEILSALSKAKNATSFEPNQSQQDAIAWALSRRISLLVGPPGTGKTRVAALLVSSALRLPRDSESKSPPRVLAVAHSNGAADVLLEALLDIGIPAIRLGRPASVSPNVRHRTVIAMADTHPEVVGLRQQSRDLTLESHLRSHMITETKHCIRDVCQTILRTAPVVVASCVGSHQLLEDDLDTLFPLVVVDEAAQTTEPGLLCALAAAKAEQVVFVGDTRQLPPTVASEAPEIREKLGKSPMARLEEGGVDQRTLKDQYRMAPALLEHPSRYFYDGLVTSASEIRADASPMGFSWPRKDAPLAFVQVGSNLEVTHEFGGKSNPVEAELVADIIQGLLQAGDVEGCGIAVISPYSKQVQRLRIELGARSIRDVRVGTVDSFQGQETDVVLFSAVRSNSDNEMGFLRDPRRLCVAITRAKRGLIIVGDQVVLQTSHHWRALISSCQERGCYLNAEDIEPARIKASQEIPKREVAQTHVGGDEVDALLSSLLESNEFLSLFDDN